MCCRFSSKRFSGPQARFAAKGGSAGFTMTDVGATGAGRDAHWFATAAGTPAPRRPAATSAATWATVPWRVRYEHGRIATAGRMAPQGVASLDGVVLSQASKLEAMRKVLQGKGVLTNVKVLEKSRPSWERAMKAI